MHRFLKAAKQVLVWLTAGFISLAMMMWIPTASILISIAVVPLGAIFERWYLKALTVIVAFMGMFCLVINMPEIAAILCVWPVKEAFKRWWSYVKLASYEREHGITYEVVT